MGLAQMTSEADMSCVASISGGLPGPEQSVPKGELYCFWRALRSTSDFLIYVTDNSAVFDGWYAHRDCQPKCEHAELWAHIGLETSVRTRAHIVILFTNSHLQWRTSLMAAVYHGLFNAMRLLTSWPPQQPRE